MTKTVQEMTNQEIFDIVAAHLIKQNRRSMRDGRCVYRGENGDMCAVGCLIKDEFYTSALEDHNFFEDSVREAVAKSLSLNELSLGSDTYKLLLALQSLHDRLTHPHTFEERLAKLAIRFKLTPYSVPAETF